MENEAYKNGFVAASGVWLIAGLLVAAYSLIFMEVEFSNTAGFRLYIGATVDREMANLEEK